MATDSETSPATEQQGEPQPEAQVVEIWTDGGCRPNPGPGAGAFCSALRGLSGNSLAGRKQPPTTVWN